jgi:FkbM family methyltransferase
MYKKIIFKIKRKFLYFINKFFKIFSLKLEATKISEKETLKKIFKNKKLIIFDIGSHQGQSIEKFLSININSEIYSFEPQPDLFFQLKKKYQGKMNIHLYPLAFDNKSRIRKFYINNRTQISGFYKTKKNLSYRNFPDINVNNKKIINIKTFTLDNFALKNKIKNIDILKIDTECNDDKVLEGAKILLKKKIPKVIMVEIISGVHFEKKISFYDIEKFLIPNNYEIFSLNKGGNFFDSAHNNLTFNVIYIKKELRRKLQLSL